MSENHSSAPISKADSRLNFKEIYSQSLGNIIGAGIITSTGICIGFTGSGVWLAYVLAGLVFLITVAPMLIAGAIVPKTSGGYYYSYLISPAMGGLYSYLFLFSSISIGFMGVSFGSYMASIVSFGSEKFWSLAVLTVFFLANLLDQKSVVKVQTFMNVLLVVAWVSFIALGAPKINWDAFTPAQMLPNGFFGMFDSIATLVFAMGGAIWLVDSGERIEDPERNIVRGNLAVVGTAALLFAVISIIAAGVLPLPEVANKPLTLVARAIYPGQSYLIFVIGGALTALATTINGRYLGAANALLRSGKEGWFPKALGKQNKNLVPYVFMAIVYILTILPILADIDTVLLNKMSAAANNVTRIIPSIGLLYVIKRFPKEWENSKYHMSKPVLTAFMALCLGVLFAVIYMNMRSFTTGMLAASFCLIAAFYIYAKIRVKYAEKVIAEQEGNQ
ncbi:APC family permease [Clostridium sp. AM58-1XD]|uniref:APC family permease n=1 Tax=Clostridium sp. AM58-1XD TaxID=2292307 RepID=UPI000E49147A|nr:APC family permease [Clostridium sp. AM58-1XD]RGY96193.1 APC family permease [Clostridium sp. AM58-1XD]